MGRDPNFLMAVERAVKNLDGKWRLHHTAQDPGREGQPPRYLLQRYGYEKTSAGKQGVWIADPAGGFETLDEVARHLGVNVDRQ